MSSGITQHMRFKAKVWAVNAPSVVVTIPYAIAQGMNIKPGDKVWMDVEKATP